MDECYSVCLTFIFFCALCVPICEKKIKENHSVTGLNELKDVKHGCNKLMDCSLCAVCSPPLSYFLRKFVFHDVAQER